ncbi:MAG TPA: hypothetical protein VFQ61_14800 [Polyangiaceae bacterium]|nr:hypothetical protein [Polyangiaceae bacterium]
MNTSAVETGIRAYARAVGAQAVRILAAGALASSILCGCSEKATQRTLPSVQVALDPSMAPIYEDGELTLYEARIGVPLPILAPTESQRSALQGTAAPPFPNAPWLTLDDARLQLSWVLTNLDDEPHAVEVLIDPWNEFGRYFPGLQLVNAEEGEYLPNLSGIDYYYSLEATSTGAASRRSGVFTFDDLDEMARDFATVMNLIQNPPPADDDGDSPTLTYVNHAFAFQNHSDRDLLVKRWLPSTIPGLVGFDVGLRSTRPVKVAIEVVAEVLDTGSGKVKTQGRSGAVLEAPTEIITAGAASAGQ